MYHSSQWYRDNLLYVSEDTGVIYCIVLPSDTGLFRFVIEDTGVSLLIIEDTVA